MLDLFLGNASDKIRNNIIYEEYNVNSPIIMEGSRNEYVYFLEKGSVDIVRYDENGNEQKIYIQEENSIFGEVELFDEKNTLFNCVTTKPSKVRKISKKLFIEWLKEDDQFFRYIYEQLVDKLLYSSTRQITESKKTIKERIIEVLKEKEMNHELQNLTKKELCVLVNAPIRSVNRVIATMNEVRYVDGVFSIV